MTSAHESHTYVYDDKPLQAHMSRGLLGQVKNFIFNIKNLQTHLKNLRQDGQNEKLAVIEKQAKNTFMQSILNKFRE